MQGRNEVRWRPGQEASLAPPRSRLRPFESKCAVLKNVLATLLGVFGFTRSDFGVTIVTRRPGDCAPLSSPCYVPLCLRPCKPTLPLRQLRIHATDVTDVGSADWTLSQSQSLYRQGFAA